MAFFVGRRGATILKEGGEEQTKGFHGTGGDRIKLHNKGGQTMGIIRLDDVIAWEDSRGEILCLDCAEAEGCTDSEDWHALTEQDFSNQDVYVFCDRNGKRIY